MKRLLLLTAGLVVILAGVVSFAAFESHIVKIKAHVESATYTTPNEIDFDTVFPQEVVYKWCGPHDDLESAECSGGGCPPPDGKCAKIFLSHSFLEQRRVKDVEYTIYCEGPSTCKEGDAECSGGKPAQAITPFIKLYDSDPDDKNDSVPRPGNCIPGKDGSPVEWATGTLVQGKVNDTEDWWDLTFYAPACRDNYNPDTDPGETPPGIPGVIENCNKGPDPDSYRWVDMEGALKFQVTGFSYCKPCRAGESACECE